MQKELLEQIVKKAKEESRELYLILSSSTSHGGYSSSSTILEINPNRISVILDSMCVRILGRVDLDITRIEEKVNDLYIPYDQILFVGIKEEN